MELDEQYWSNRYRQGDTGWDIGKASTPLAAFIQGMGDGEKKKKVLVPGCGNAYEAEVLLQAGFTQISLVDISGDICRELSEKFAGAIEENRMQVIHADYFKLEGSFDLILEQTFFCALDPVLRPAYVQKTHELLNPGGCLAGLLFNRDFEGGPPFGGHEAEYLALFEPLFNIEIMEPCRNSIKPRAGTELFFIMRKMS